MATPRIFVSPSDQFNNKYAYGNTTEGDQCKKIASALVAALLRNKFEFGRVLIPYKQPRRHHR